MAGVRFFAANFLFLALLGPMGLAAAELEKLAPGELFSPTLGYRLEALYRRAIQLDQPLPVFEGYSKSMSTAFLTRIENWSDDLTALVRTPTELEPAFAAWRDRKELARQAARLRTGLRALRQVFQRPGELEKKRLAWSGLQGTMSAIRELLRAGMKAARIGIRGDTLESSEKEGSRGR